MSVETRAAIQTGSIEGQTLIDVLLASVSVKAARALTVERVGSVVTRGPIQTRVRLAKLSALTSVTFDPAWTLTSEV